MKTKHPGLITVFYVITSDILSLIFPHTLRLDMEAYIKCPEEAVLPWIETMAAGRAYIRQEDSMLCHTSMRIQSWLEENFCEHIT